MRETSCGFSRDEAKTETTLSRANALLHTFTFFETRETRTRDACDRPYRWFFCHRALVRTSYGHSVTRVRTSQYTRQLGTRRLSVDDVIVFRLVPDTPERLPERPASLLPRSARLDGEVHVILLLHLVHGVHVGGAREPEQRARDEVVAWRALARPVVGRQVVQTHAVFALALRHRARARVLPDLSDRGSLRRVRPSATRPRATRCGRIGAPVAFSRSTRNLRSVRIFFAEKKRRVEDARAYVRRETKLMLRLRLQVATCLLCLLFLLSRAFRARLSESDQSTSIMKSAQPSGKPDSYEDRRETHGFLVTSLVPTLSKKRIRRRFCATALFTAAVGTNGDADGRRVRDDLGGVGRALFERTREAENDRRKKKRRATRDGRDRRNDETNALRESL